MEIIPLKGTSAIWASQCPAFLNPESPQGAPLWEGRSDCQLDDCNIFCLLKWQATFLIHIMNYLGASQVAQW